MQVWALTVAKDEKYVVSGGADSVITLWEDVTESEELEKMQEQADQVLQCVALSALSPLFFLLTLRISRREQDYENFLALKDYSNAILLALSMNQPRRLLNLFTEVRLTSGSSSTDPSANAADLLSYTGSRHVDIVLQKLSPSELRQLLGYIRDWNTVARSAETAQAILHAILKFHDADQILATLEGKAPGQEVEEETEEEEESDEEEDEQEKKRRKRKARKPDQVKANEVLGALIPYTERHMARADKLVRESFIVEHLLGMMEGFDDFDVTEPVAAVEEQDRMVEV